MGRSVSYTSRTVAADYVKVAEAAVLLGVSEDAIRDAVERGELPARRLGRRILIPIAALRELEPVVTR